jgi:hypothetical protein
MADIESLLESYDSFPPLRTRSVKLVSRGKGRGGVVGTHSFTVEIGMLDAFHNHGLRICHLGLVVCVIVIVTSIIVLDFGASCHHGQGILADYANVPEVSRETLLVKGMLIFVVVIVVVVGR